MLSLLILMSVLAYGGDKLVEIHELICYNDSGPGRVELTVKEARVSIAGLISFNTRAYHILNESSGNLEPMFPGPTIIMKGGHECELLLKNELPARDGENCTMENNTDGSIKQGYYCSDTTNIHTHGLWVSPWEDYIGSHANPGGSWTYKYNLKMEYMPGTFWYHAHHHGSVFLSIYGGQAGALIVEPAISYEQYFSGNSSLISLYNHAQVLVLFQAFFGGNDNENGYAKTSDTYWMADYVGVANHFPNKTIDPNVKFEVENLKDFYTVNGQYQPVVNLFENHTILLRIVHASGVRVLNLIVDADESTNSKCEMKLIARDGIFQYTPYRTIKSIVLYQGTRSDVAFKCPRGTYNVRTEPRREMCKTAGSANLYIQETVFSLNVMRNASFKETDFPTTEAYFPWYLTNGCHNNSLTRNYGYYKVETFTFTPFKNKGWDLQAGIMTKMFPGFWFERKREKYFNEPYNSKWNPWVERYCLNEQYQINFWFGNESDRFDPQSCEEGMEEAVENALLNNKTVLQNSGSTKNGSHPYHQHINPFQIYYFRQGDANTGADVARHCEWRDTIPGSINYYLIFTPRYYTGDVIVHCHLIQHEDHGMMGFYDVTDDAQYCKGSLPTSGLTENDPKTCTDPKTWLWLLVGFASGALVIYAAIRSFSANKRETHTFGKTKSYEESTFVGGKSRGAALELMNNETSDLTQH